MVSRSLDKWTPIQMKQISYILFALLLFVCFTSLKVYGKDEYEYFHNKFEKKKRYMEDKRIYDKFGKFQFKITTDGKIYDPYGKYIGQLKIKKK